MKAIYVVKKLRSHFDLKINCIDPNIITIKDLGVKGIHLKERLLFKINHFTSYVSALMGKRMFRYQKRNCSRAKRV